MRTKRLVVIGLATLALWFVGLFLFLGWLVGVLPLYPHAANFQICSAPEFHTFDDTDSWEFWVSTCFNTPDSSDQVYAWYERIGWSGNNLPTDRSDSVTIGELKLATFVQLLAKRRVIMMGNRVSIGVEYEMYSSICSPQTWLYPARSWSLGEIGSLIQAFVRACSTG